MSVQVRLEALKLAVAVSVSTENRSGVLAQAAAFTRFIETGVGDCCGNPQQDKRNKRNKHNKRDKMMVGGE